MEDSVENNKSAAQRGHALAFIIKTKNTSSSGWAAKRVVKKNYFEQRDNSFCVYVS